MLVNNKLNVIKVFRKKNFKDECGNKGEDRTFKSIYRVLDLQGNEVVAPKKVICISRMIPGHCA